MSDFRFLLLLFELFPQQSAGGCRALLSLLPRHWLSPGVGPVLGCQGMLGFVLMPPRYGFELVLGANDLQAHHGRYLSPVALGSHVLQETLV